MSESVFNEGSIDVDFRVEGSTVTHAFFVEGETDRVGIGTNDPAAIFDVQGSTGSNYVGSFTNTSSTGWGAFVKGGADNADYTLRIQDKDANDLLSVKGGGRIGIGTNDPQALTHIKGADTVVSGTYGEQLLIEDTAAYNAAQYAGISFKAQYHSNGSVAHIAQIVGDRPDTGSGTYNGQLYFLTRTSGSDLEKALTLDYNQNATFAGNLTVNGTVELKHGINISTGSASVYPSIIGQTSDYELFRLEQWYGNEGSLVIKKDGSNVIRFTGGSSGVTSYIDNGANFGIGDQSPGMKLTVVSDASTGYAASFHNDGNNADRYGIRVLAGTDNGSGVNYHYSAMDGDGDLEGALRVSSGTFALYDNSDRRLKDNIRDTKINGTDIVNSMKVRDFEWKKSGLTETAGFVAQELKESFEPASPDSEDDLYEGKPKMMAVSRDRLVPVLVKAFQELSAQVTALEGN